MNTEAVLDETAGLLLTVKEGLESAGEAMKRATGELESRQRRIDRLRNALAGVVGLVQLIESRAESHPREELRLAVADMVKNHRLLEAVQVLALEEQL